MPASSTSASGASPTISPTNPTNDQAAVEKDKTRLTEQEKKNNHIASEQKRRAAIREGFDRLTELVPGLEGQGRSESIVLQRTVQFLREQIRVRRELVQELEESGGVVVETLKI